MEIKKFTKQLNDEQSLSNNSILTIFIDNRDQLWILTINYLHRYNRSTDKFDRYCLTSQKISYRYDNKGMIVQDHQGNIWIGSPICGLFQFDAVSGECKSILPQLLDISSLFPDNEGNLWIGHGKGEILKYNIKTGYSKNYIVPQNLHRPVKDDYVWQIQKCDDENILMLLSSGFFKLDISTGNITSYDSINSRIPQKELELRRFLMEKNDLWIGTQGQGLFRISLVNGSTTTYQTIIKNKNSLSNNTITAIFRDNYNVLWVATKDGLNKYDPKSQMFTHYQHDPQKQDNLHYNFISSFCEGPENNIWIGTFGKGISVFDPDRETFRSMMKEPGNPNSLVNDAVRALEPDMSGHIWVGTVDGLSSYDTVTQHFKNFNLSSFTSSNIANDILSLLVTNDSTLWIGTNGAGALSAKLDGQNIWAVKNFSTNNRYLTSDKVRRMIHLANGAVGLGTFGGGVSIIRDKLIKVIIPSEVSMSTESDYVNALCEDENKNLWIGTWDGLFLSDSTYTIVKQWGTNNGLPSGEITGILSADENNIWVGTMNGLAHMSDRGDLEYAITNYSTRDGLQGTYFTTYSTLKTKSGEMYFGGYNGFNRFSPSKILVNQEIPKVVFTDFQVFHQSIGIGEKVKGKVLLRKNILDTKSITLNYKHRVIGFKFAALNTSQIEKVKYAYRLEGFNDEWIYNSYNNRLIVFSNFPPGSYILTVRACNTDGIWDEKGTYLQIRVHPPFWRSWGAYFIYFGLFIGLLLLVRQITVTQTELKHKALVEQLEREKETKINSLKIKYFINISHEIRTPLTLIVPPLEKLLKIENLSKEVKESLNLIYRNAMRLLTLINQLLEFRRIETGNLRLQVTPIDIVSFIYGIKKSFEPHSLHQDIEFNFSSNVEKLILWFDADCLEKIMYNLLSNAFKFTPRGKSIALIVRYLDTINLCEIEVRDTGIGIPADKIEKVFDRFYQVDTLNYSTHQLIRSGIGLSIVKNLVELHQGKIWIESEEGSYSVFKIQFKMGKDHFENLEYASIKDEEEKTRLITVKPEIEISDVNWLDLPPDSLDAGTKVLIVEDNLEIRKYLKHTLRSSYEVLEAENGKEGFQKAIEFIPDLIISDVMMPKMDGYEMSKKLKNEVLTLHIPIIILTAKSDLDDALEGFATGIDEFIPKPFNEQLLLAKINSLILNRKKLQQKFQFVSKGIDVRDEESQFKSDPFIRQVVDFIRDNLSDIELNNTKIEAHFKTSKMQLYRKLKAVTDMSVTGLIKKVRIEEASHLLRSSDFNVSEISFRLGFNDPLYFSRFFKKEVGLSPKQYKKKFQNTVVR